MTDAFILYSMIWGKDALNNMGLLNCHVLGDTTENPWFTSVTEPGIMAVSHAGC